MLQMRARLTRHYTNNDVNTQRLNVPKHEIFDPLTFTLNNFIFKYVVKRFGGHKHSAPIFFDLAMTILKMLAITEYAQAPY